MQDSLFKYKHIPMGVFATTGWFQHIIDSVLDTSEANMAGAFLDDITVGGPAADQHQCWDTTLRVMRTLVEFAFMLNLYKYKFLVSNTAVLGFEL